jgi:hypothetical protein
MWEFPSPSECGIDMKKLFLLPLMIVALASCSDGSDNIGELDANVLVFTDHEFLPSQLQALIDDSDNNAELRLSGQVLGKPITIVKLSGKTNHFGRHLNGDYIDYHATVPDTPVWIAEYPWTRDLGIQTDETGWWTMYVVKDAGEDLEFSFIFDREGWITTKTNINTIGDADDTDFAIQYIDPDFYNVLMLPYVEDILRGGGYPNFFFDNAMVVTVGKSWGSMHDDRLPHGDPGATVTMSPEEGGFIGPIYFNEQVIPDLGWDSVSVDGGVVWLNLPRNTIYHASAVKEGVTYPTVRFNINDADVEAGVQLYIASPPDSLEGSNDSGPGEP